MIQKVWLKGVRNLDEVLVQFEKDIPLFIYGDNNQGKTSFLEGVFFAFRGGSPLPVSVGDVVRVDASELCIGVDFLYGDADHRLYFSCQKSGAKKVSVDNKPVQQLSRLPKYVNISFLSSDIIRIFQESPDFRRRDLDRFCAQYFDGYDIDLKKYERVLKQKNRVLREEGPESDVELWNEQLVILAVPLIHRRLEALTLLEARVNLLISTIYPEFQDQVSLQYAFCRLEGLLGQEDYKDVLKAKLFNDRQKERYLGYSLVGPQRDDFGVLIHGKPLYSFYSRGINRMMAVVLTMAQLLELNNENSRYPVLLLDDTFAEVDQTNKKKLLDMILSYAQVIYTSISDQDRHLFDRVFVKKMVKGTLLDG